MKPYYKNIEKDDFCKMLKFIMIWQEKISTATSNKKLEKTFPLCGEKFIKLTKDLDVQNKNYQELQSLSSINNNQYFEYRRKTRMLSFLNHLRNAIAHGHIERVGDFYHFYDLRYKTKPNLSAFGIVSKEIINGVINIFIK